MAEAEKFRTATGARLWEMAGLKPYDGPVPPVGDPHALDDTELLRRLVPVAASIWSKRPRQVPLDEESLFCSLLWQLFKKAREFDPGRAKLITALVGACQWSWQREAEAVRVMDTYGERSAKRVGRTPWRPVDPRYRDEVFDTLEGREGQPEDTPAEADSRRQNAETVAALLAALPTDRHRQVVRLRLMEGLSIARVGEIMGVSKERVRQLEWKSLRMLRAKASAGEPALGKPC